MMILNINTSLYVIVLSVSTEGYAVVFGWVTSSGALFDIVRSEKHRRWHQMRFSVIALR